MAMRSKQSRRQNQTERRISNRLLQRNDDRQQRRTNRATIQNQQQQQQQKRRKTGITRNESSIPPSTSNFPTTKTSLVNCAIPERHKDLPSTLKKTQL